MTFIRILLTVRAKCRDLFFGLRPSSVIISCYNSIWTCDKKDMNYKLGGTQPMHEHEAYCSKLCYSFEVFPSTFCFTFWGVPSPLRPCYIWDPESGQCICFSQP